MELTYQMIMKEYTICRQSYIRLINTCIIIMASLLYFMQSCDNRTKTETNQYVFTTIRSMLLPNVMQNQNRDTVNGVVYKKTNTAALCPWSKGLRALSKKTGQC